MTALSPMMMTETDEDKFERQFQLEEAMRGLGIEAFRERFERYKERNEVSQTQTGKRLVVGAHERMEVALTEFIEAAKSGKAGRKHAAVKYAEKLPVEVVANITIRVIVDSLCAEAPALSGIATKIAGMLEDEVNSRTFRKEMPHAHKKFLKRANEESVYRRKASHLLKPAELLGVDLEDWPERDRLLLGIKLVELFVQSTGLVDKYIKQIGKKRTITCVAANDNTLKWVEEENKRIEWLYPLYLPTIIPPKPWTNVHDGGYYTRHIRSLNLVKTSSRAHLEELEDRDMEAVYDAVNALQETAWQINKPVLGVMKHFWESGLYQAKIPSPDTLDLPPKPPHARKAIPREEWTEEMETEFREWKTDATIIHKLNAKMRGRRFQFLKLFWVAKKFAEEEEIYFPHQLDWRGRIYPIPMYLNPQGNDLARGLLTFATTVPIKDAEDELWLCIHGAGLWGVDKVSFEERRAWIKEHSDEIAASGKDPLADKFWLTAEKPWQALAFCLEWSEYVEQGFGYESSLPVQMDGSCNGLQNFSAMLRDHIGGEATNLTVSERPQDIYQKVADKTIERVREDALRKPEDEWENMPICVKKTRDMTEEEYEARLFETRKEIIQIAQGWLGNITRKVTKRPVMTLSYGAKRFGFVQQVEEDTIKPWREEDGETYPFLVVENGQVKDLGSRAALYMGGLIWDSVGEVVVAAVQAMEWLQNAAKTASKVDAPILWSTPSGFLVQQAYRVSQLRRIETTFCNTRLTAGIDLGDGKIDSRKQASGISPNWIHSLDASHLMLTVQACRKKGIRSFSMIHDSYGTHAGNAWYLAAELRHQFVEMYTNTDVLKNFREDLELQTGAELPALPEKGELDLEEVRRSPFFFA